MIKLVKNHGQCVGLKGKCKYLLYVNDKTYGDMYAKPGLKPVIGRIIALMKYGS